MHTYSWKHRCFWFRQMVASYARMYIEWPKMTTEPTWNTFWGHGPRCPLIFLQNFFIKLTCQTHAWTSGYWICYWDTCTWTLNSFFLYVIGLCSVLPLEDNNPCKDAEMPQHMQTSEMYHKMAWDRGPNETCEIVWQLYRISLVPHCRIMIM